MVYQDRPWQPPLGEKGAEIVNDRHRYLLVTGPKKCAKTISICHKAALHLYEYPNAHVGLITKRQEVARTGVWPDITDFAIEKIWQQEAGALFYHTKPRVSDTKRRIFSTYTRNGGTSKCTLVTAFRDSEIEECLKQSRFSFIYVNEADQFSETIFSACADQLRMTHLGIPEEAHQLVLDCNPPAQGEKHWLHKLFLDPNGKDDAWRRNYNTIQCVLADNPWLSQNEIDDLVNRYKNNPRLLSRYVYGIWVPTSEGSLFEESFKDEIHVAGSRIPSRPKTEWPILIPPRETSQLFVGWDPGDVNHSAVIFSKRWTNDRHEYDILEDVTNINKKTSTRMFAKLVQSRIDYWIELLKRRGATMVSVSHWSDPSAFSYKSTGNKTIAQEIAAATDRRVILKPVKKGPKSVEARTTMMSDLLNDRRILVSVLAENMINALIGLKPGRNGGIAKSPLLHTFDAGTYGLSAEIAKDLANEENNEDDGHRAIAGRY